MNAVTDLFGQGMVIAYPAVIVFWIIIHSKIDRWRRIGRQAYWIAFLTWLLISLPMLYFRVAIFSVRWPMPWWGRAVGVGAAGLAVWFGWRAYLVIPIRTLVGLPELQPQTNTQPLLESGIYSRTRNPVYLMHTLLVVVAVCFTGYAAGWALLAFDAVFLPWMIRTEEHELRQRYGVPYADYMARVPRFFPKLFR